MKQSYRSYSTHKDTGSKLVLVSWIQGRCLTCQRFLAKHQHNYCVKHGCKSIIHREAQKLRASIYHNPERYNIGDYV